MRLIDADALTKRLIEFCNKNCPYTAKARDIMCGSCFMGLALEAVEDAPTIDSEQRWISCKERLPEDGQNVLVTYKTTDKIHPCQYHDDGSRNPWYSYIDQCRAHMNVVLAWMPLPEPWKEGEK